MLDRLETVENRLEEINNKLMEPNVANDQEKYASLMKEFKRLTPIVEKYRDYKRAKNAYEEAKEMLEEGGLEKDLRELAQEQYDENKDAMDTYAQELKILLLPQDPNDDKNVIVEIRGGAGGDEAALFAGSLYRMYCMYAESVGWKGEILSANETELGGFKRSAFLSKEKGPTPS